MTGCQVPASEPSLLTLSSVLSVALYHEVFRVLKYFVFSFKTPSVGLHRGPNMWQTYNKLYAYVLLEQVERLIGLAYKLLLMRGFSF